MSSLRFYSEIRQQKPLKVMSPLHNSLKRPFEQFQAVKPQELGKKVQSRHVTQSSRTFLTAKEDQNSTSQLKNTSRNNILVIQRKPIFPKNHKRKSNSECDVLVHVQFTRSLQHSQQRDRKRLDSDEVEKTPNRSSVKKRLFHNNITLESTEKNNENRNDPEVYNFTSNYQRETSKHFNSHKYFSNNRAISDNYPRTSPPIQTNGLDFKYGIHPQIGFLKQSPSKHNSNYLQKSIGRPISPENQTVNLITQPKLQSHQIPYIIGDSGPLYDRDVVTRTPVQSPISLLHENQYIQAFTNNPGQRHGIHKQLTHSETISQMKKIINDLQGKFTSLERVQTVNKSLKERNERLQKEISLGYAYREQLSAGPKVTTSRFGQYLQSAKGENSSSSLSGKQYSQNNNNQVERYFTEKIVNYKQKMNSAKQIIQLVMERIPNERSRLLQVLELLDISEADPNRHH